MRPGLQEARWSAVLPDLLKKMLCAALLAAIIAVFSGCAAMELGSIAKPSDTIMLRVALIPFSENVSRGGWRSSTEDFVANQYRGTTQLLEKLGYYQVVPEPEVKAVLAGNSPDIWSLTSNNSELAVRIGRALYADYVMLAERGAYSGDFIYYFELMLINVETGRKTGVRIENDRRNNHKKLPPGVGRLAYRQLFKDASSDLLATALRKSRSLAEPLPVTQTVEEEERLKRLKQAEDERNEKEKLARIKADEQKLASTGVVNYGSRIVGYDVAEKQENQTVAGAKSLIVYDFAASGNYQPVAVILSEAMREEILRRGRYNLINRENLQQIIGELKFQQSGLVDVTQAIQLGKGAGASEIVTGNIGPLGRTLVLQSKRTDLQTLANLSISSMKSELGQEDTFLSRLSEMVDRLFQAK